MTRFDLTLDKIPYRKATCDTCSAFVIVVDGKRYETTGVDALAIIPDPYSGLPQRGDGTAYRRHKCSPLRVKAKKAASKEIVRLFSKEAERYGFDDAGIPGWIERQGKARAVYRKKRAEVDALVKSEAQRRACPKCEVAAGLPCENLIERCRGVSQPTKMPHQERLDLIDPNFEKQRVADLEAARKEYAEIDAKVSAMFAEKGEQRSIKDQYVDAATALAVEQAMNVVYGDGGDAPKSCQRKKDEKVSTDNAPSYSPWPSDHPTW